MDIKYDIKLQRNLYQSSFRESANLPLEINKLGMICTIDSSSPT